MKRSTAAAAAVILIFAVAVSAAVLQSVMSPPMVVSSRSMQHDDYESQLGTLDTGDLVIIDYNKDPSEIVTYAQAYSQGYTRFGGFGDVILYQTEKTDVPIIHRALCRLEYNENGTFSMPELSLLPDSMWSTESGGWENISGKVYLYGIGHLGASVPIDLDKILRNMGSEPHGGMLTMGDNNTSTARYGTVGHIDQTSLSSVNAPIKDEEIIGTAAAEIPWAGTLKLIVTGNAPDYLPRNSVIILAAIAAAGTASAAAACFILRRK